MIMYNIPKCIIKPDWKYKLKEDFKFNLYVKADKDIYFYDQKNKCRAILHTNGHMTVKKGYAWDGCSPKFIIFNFIHFGTPDGKIDNNTGVSNLYYPSLIHDVLCQFKYQLIYKSNNLIDQWYIDNIFMLYMRLYKVSVFRSLFYYLCVRIYQEFIK